MKDCLFCKIIKGKTKTKFLYQDKDVVAFRDINPKAPIHVLIVPRKHIAKLQDIGDNDKELLGQIFLVARKMAQSEKIAESGYKVVVNCGEGAGQIVPHLHFHLLGGWRKEERGC